ncbi:MAG: DUF1015 domain-containing protein [Clostridiaceae bacterium]|nr:DUF1015 domain-containing protein [Clostridiaceae bacterium]
MAKIRAFRAIRPVAKYASEVAALPYDVMNSEEARTEIQGKPNSFMRIDRPETTLDKNIDIYDERVYQQAVINMNSLIERGIMQQDSTANLYLYELTMNDRSQTGVVCCASVDEYLNETIKKHEKTRADKLADRIKHVDVLDANTGPIFLAYKKQEKINAIVTTYKQNQAEYDFTASDGVTHRIWVIDDSAIIQKLIDAFAEIDVLYIADGHHRCASGVEVAKKRRVENPDYSGDEEFNYFLAVVFSDHELKIMDYNRLVKDLNGLSEDEFFEKIKEKFNVENVGNKIYHPQTKAEFGMYYQSKWYKLTAKPGTFDPKDPVNSLDVAIMQNNLLHPILGIEDPRTDQRIDFVGGIRGLTELERRVDSGEMKVAFSMYPTSISELFDVADANELMPPKSTWFEPKLRSGLFIHKLS